MFTAAWLTAVYFSRCSSCGVPVFQARGVNLSCVRSCVVIAEERPRLALTHSFSKLFKDVGLSSRAVSTAFGSRVNLAVCLQVWQTSVTLTHQHAGIWTSGATMYPFSCLFQGTTGPDPCTVYVDMKSLRHDRHEIVDILYTYCSNHRWRKKQ